MPTRIYLAAGIGLTLLAAALFYAMLTSSAALDTSVPLPMLIAVAAGWTAATDIESGPARRGALC